MVCGRVKRNHLHDSYMTIYMYILFVVLILFYQFFPFPLKIATVKVCVSLIPLTMENITNQTSMV